MKNTILIIMSFLIHLSCFSQDTGNTNSSMDPKSGGFGGPLIGATQIMDDWGIMIGGKGGGIINHKFAFGGVGMALVGGHDFVGDNLGGIEDASLNLGLGAGGVFIEYIHKRDNLIQFSIPLHIMAGGVSVEENETEVESSAIFILEPGLNLEFNVSDGFIPGIHVSYRQVFGSSLENVSNQDISGIYLGLVFKFGKF